MNAFEALENSVLKSKKIIVPNVGIGTTAPGYKLSIYDPTLATYQNIESGGNGTAAVGRFAGKTAGAVSRSYLTGMNISDGTGSYEIYDQTGAGASRLYVSATGNVGIGTTAPRGNFDVNGAIISAAAPANATGTVNFSTGNLQYTTSNCGAFIFHNMKDGASYSFAVQGATATTCSFTAFSVVL